MSAVRRLDIKNTILKNASCLGNSKIGFKEVCSTLIDDACKRGEKINAIADRAYLSTKTVERMWKLKECESGMDYRPNADTCERILKAFDAGVFFDHVKINPKNQNQPKEKL